jgi:hypothetical protein
MIEIHLCLPLGTVNAGKVWGTCLHVHQRYDLFGVGKGVTQNHPFRENAGISRGVEHLHSERLQRNDIRDSIC